MSYAIVASNRQVTLQEWEWFVLSRRMDKPVEMIMIEDASHVVQKPADRMIASGGTVDWFDFWLNGKRDSRAEKDGQYRRWEALKSSSRK